MTNQIMRSLVPLQAIRTPRRPVVYSSPDHCLCGASLDLESDSATITVARVRQPDGSRPYRIVSCDMCPRD
jgi:hypothetical protein